MGEELWVVFEAGGVKGPFYAFEAAFSAVVKYGKDARIETKDDKVLATWNHWTGLYKVGAKYKYLVVDNEFNRQNYPTLVNQLVDEAPSYAMVREVEVA